MKTIKLSIFDETLRDGEQQVGIFFSSQVKYKLAQLILATGVDYLALMPKVHEVEEILSKNLIKKGFNNNIVASTMSNFNFIDHAQQCGVERIILFHAVSDRLLWLRDDEIKNNSDYKLKTIDDYNYPDLIRKVRQKMLDKIGLNLEYACSQGLKVSFAAEDASRTDFDFLVECINSFSPYIEHFILCDTLGVLTPEKTYIWLKDLIELTHHNNFILHFHNDLGLALENTIQGIVAGAKGISGTFGGIGERAGNVAIEQVLNGLRLRFGWEVEGIDYNALNAVTDYLSKLGIKANPPYSSEALCYEAGIHVNSLLKDPLSYYPFPYGKPEIWSGKFSGISNIRYLVEQYLNQSLSQTQYEQLRAMIKNISIEKECSFSTQEILKLLSENLILKNKSQQNIVR